MRVSSIFVVVTTPMTLPSVSVTLLPVSCLLSSSLSGLSVTTIGGGGAAAAAQFFC